MKAPKYKNVKVEVDGIKFDSKDEAHFYEYLKKLKDNKEILDFSLKPKFTLFEPYFYKYAYKNRKRLGCTYELDFCVIKLNGDRIYYDVKSIGNATQQGIMRRKLLEIKYPHINLVWICRNFKHGDKDGWIIYEELKEVLAKQRKLKKAGEAK